MFTEWWTLLFSYEATPDWVWNYLLRLRITSHRLDVTGADKKKFQNFLSRKPEMYIENNTWARGMWIKSACFRSLRSLVRYRVEHEKRNSISPSNPYCFVYYINILLTRKSPLISRFKKRKRCQSFMALNRASYVLAADWLSQTSEKLSLFFTCGDTLFLSIDR